MNLSLSCRIAEGFLSKEEAILTMDELADLAADAGYSSICMRASQIGVHTPIETAQLAAETLRERGVTVSMVTGDFDIVYNNDRGPLCLRNITPYLDLAETLGAPMLRICIKEHDDIPYAQRAADEAAERGLQLVHQCHLQSLFETIDGIEAALKAIDRKNFGLIYEAANLEECRQDYGAATVRRLGPWIRNVYLQNQRIKPDGAVTLNSWCHGPVSFDILQVHEPGGIDFPSVFEGLHAIDYDGPVTVHQSAPEDETRPVDAAAQTATYLKTLLQQ